MTNKGEKVRFVGGKYVGKKGWLNNDKGDTTYFVYVIVDLGNGKTKETRVSKENVASPHTAPASYEEAVLQQIPEIEALMDKLARELAKCHVEVKDSSAPILEIMGLKIRDAMAKQVRKGSKATWRMVKFSKKK